MTEKIVLMNGHHPLSLNGYQADASAFAIYPKGKAFEYLLNGIGGEVGELQSKWAKNIRDGIDTEDNLKAVEQLRNDMVKECGDILWFIALIAKELGFSLQHVAEVNTEKLASRKKRNKLKGSGDDR